MKPVVTFACVVLLLGIFAALPVVASMNQNHSQPDLTDQPVVEDPIVDFGHPDILAGTPNQAMVPDEVTILKGDRVNFRVNGAGHGIVIYPVSKHTTRDDIGQYLCDATKPGCLATEGREIRDREGRVVIIVDEGGQSVRVDYEPGQILSAGTAAFLPGTIRNPQTGVITPGIVMRLRFEEQGRYLVACMNRAHLVNEWMFGFVNVTTHR